MKRLPVVVVHYLWLWPTSYSFGILKSRRRARGRDWMNPNWIRYFNGQNSSNTPSAREVTRLVPTRDQGRKTLGREW